MLQQGLLHPPESSGDRLTRPPRGCLKRVRKKKEREKERGGESERETERDETRDERR